MLKICKPVFYIALIFETIFTPSCSSEKRTYQYIETSTKTNGLTTAAVERKPMAIMAGSDSAAYLEAFTQFSLGKKFYADEYKKSGALSGNPISFKLINEKGVDIAAVVSFSNKVALETAIIRRVALLKVSDN
ncbi:MAG: hypothetical protein EOO05_16910 [Chitinophagaceae bacterium]|nr:MAG: hypothetical protein EOO05_16910 [Chitinophagaceae bacterium]